MGWTDLYATGFNAWGQVLFKPKHRVPVEPEDVNTFTRVLHSLTNDFRDVESYLAYTVVTTTTRTLTAGMIPKWNSKLYSPQSRTSYRLVAEAANGQVTVLDHEGDLRQHASARMFCQSKHHCLVFSGFSDVIQLVGYDVGFAALDRTGRVYTWGDHRYPLCLGREVTKENPADRPCLVPDLIDLPTGKIAKIAANGYVIAALTDGNDLYCWGGHAGQEPVIPGLNGTPNLVDIDGKEILDVAVGESHLIVLTEDDKVMVIGNNTYGQLGIGIGAEKATTWTEVKPDLGKESTVMAVRAGPKTSFLIVENNWEVDEEMSASEDEAKTGEDENKASRNTKVQRG